MVNHLAVDAHADSMHRAGLDSMGAGQYDETMRLYTYALGHLESDESCTLGSPERDVQAVRITRDLGFTMLRQTLELTQGAEIDLPDVVGGVGSAERELRIAHGSMQRLIAAGPHELTDIQQRQIISEDAATQGTMLRLGTARAALAQTYPKFEIPLAVPDTIPLNAKDVYDRAKGGSNQYYATSIAMNAAKDVRVRGGSIVRAVPWLARAATSVVRSVVSDRDSVKPSLQTSGRILKEIRSKRSAVRAAIDHRTV